MNFSLAAVDPTRPVVFLALVVAVFVVLMARYALLGGLFHLYFYVWFRKIWANRKINLQPYPAAQFRKEIYWSILTALIFAVVGALTIVAWQKGYTRIYLNIHDYPWYWFPLSIFLAMLIHETYYYWLHRWMHRPNVFKRIHKVHHDSQITSPWTAFSFHPLEGLLEALILPLIICIVPMHYYALIVHLTIMTVSAAVNHLDIEIYPRNAAGDVFGKHVVGATHHSQHHKYYRFNFGLYFTFWDRWGKTESPHFDRAFAERGIQKKEKV